MSVLLDSNTWVALLRWQNAGVLAKLKQLPPAETLVCSVVLAELWYGAERSDPSRRAANRALVDELSARYSSLPFDDLAAREYAVIRADLAAKAPQLDRMIR